MNSTNVTNEIIEYINFYYPKYIKNFRANVCTFHYSELIVNKNTECFLIRDMDEGVDLHVSVFLEKNEIKLDDIFSGKVNFKTNLPTIAEKNVPLEFVVLNHLNKMNERLFCEYKNSYVMPDGTLLSCVKIPYEGEVKNFSSSVLLDENSGGLDLLKCLLDLCLVQIFIFYNFGVVINPQKLKCFFSMKNNVSICSGFYVNDIMEIWKQITKQPLHLKLIDEGYVKRTFKEVHLKEPTHEFTKFHNLTKLLNCRPAKIIKYCKNKFSSYFKVHKNAPINAPNTHNYNCSSEYCLFKQRINVVDQVHYIFCRNSSFFNILDIVNKLRILDENENLVSRYLNVYHNHVQQCDQCKNFSSVFSRPC